MQGFFLKGYEKLLVAINLDEGAFDPLGAEDVKCMGV